MQRGRVIIEPDDNEGEANLNDSPQMNFSADQVDERPEHNKQDFNQQSVHLITPNYQHSEFIVDFQLIERPTDLSLIYTTHLNNIYFKNLT